MKIAFAISFIIISLTCIAQSDTLVIQVLPNGSKCIRVDEKHGLIDASGEVIIEPILESIPIRVLFGDRSYYVSRLPSEEFMLFDTLGNLVKGPLCGGIWKGNDRYKHPKKWLEFSENKNNKPCDLDNTLYGFMDYNLKVVVEPISSRPIKFDRIKIGWGEITNDDEEIGIIDTNGIILFEPMYDKIYPFNEHINSLFKVRKNGNFGYIDTFGIEVIQPIYTSIESVDAARSGWHKVRNEHSVNFINSKWKLIFEDEYSGFGKIGSESLNLIRIYKGTLTGFADTNGNIVIEPIFSYIENFVPNVRTTAYAELGGRLGKLDTAGNVLIPFKYDEISEYSQKFKDLALVKNKKYYGFVDRQGVEVIKTKYLFIYDAQESWGNKLVARKRFNRLVWIDRYGNEEPYLNKNSS